MSQGHITDDHRRNMKHWEQNIGSGISRHRSDSLQPGDVVLDRRVIGVQSQRSLVIKQACNSSNKPRHSPQHSRTFSVHLQITERGAPSQVGLHPGYEILADRRVQQVQCPRGIVNRLEEVTHFNVTSRSVRIEPGTRTKWRTDRRSELLVKVGVDLQCERKCRQCSSIIPDSEKRTGND